MASGLLTALLPMLPRFGERVFNCVQGIHSLEALNAAGKENLNGKLLIDLANPYIYKDGHISLDSRWSGTTSLGEEAQKILPDAKVVKTLNYLCNHLMVHPKQLPEAITASIAVTMLTRKLK